MYEKYIKRVLDVTLSFLMLIILSPLFLILSVGVFLSFGFPIIFKQERVGKDKKIFVIYKFKILRNGATEKRIDTMTKATQFMNEYNLNELPQLINVIKGDMSLVGPRPFIENKNKKDNEEKRYSLRPGMTGFAQVNGGSKMPRNKKYVFDDMYIDKISFLLDLKILLLTPFRIFKYREIIKK